MHAAIREQLSLLRQEVDKMGSFKTYLKTNCNRRDYQESFQMCLKGLDNVEAELEKCEEDVIEFKMHTLNDVQVDKTTNLQSKYPITNPFNIYKRM